MVVRWLLEYRRAILKSTLETRWLRVSTVRIDSAWQFLGSVRSHALLACLPFHKNAGQSMNHQGRDAGTLTLAATSTRGSLRASRSVCGQSQTSQQFV